jgi:Arc/MetJ-type ribon-helix-helix transcriptional regulator
MRAVINISLPQAMVRDVEEHVKTGKYASKSEFFRDLLRSWQEDQILKDVRQSRKEFAMGKGKLLKSFKDLE